MRLSSPESAVLLGFATLTGAFLNPLAAQSRASVQVAAQVVQPPPGPALVDSTLRAGGLGLVSSSRSTRLALVRTWTEPVAPSALVRRVVIEVSYVRN